MAEYDGGRRPDPRLGARHGEKTFHDFIEGEHGRHGGSLESEGRPQEREELGDSSRRPDERVSEQTEATEGGAKRTTSQRGQVGLHGELDRDHNPGKNAGEEDQSG